MLVCSWLPLPALSALATSCTTARDTIHDHIWAPHLDKLLFHCGMQQAMPLPVVLADTGTSASSATTAAVAVRRLPNLAAARAELHMRASAEAADERDFADALERLALSSGSVRLKLGRLRSLLCSLCSLRAGSAMYFPVTERGVCHACIRERPAAADAWRHAQSDREHRAIAQQNRAVATKLSHDVLPALLTQPGPPPTLIFGQPQLLFTSDRDGGSVAALLRHARGATYSILLVTERPDPHRPHDTPTHKFGAFCPAPWPSCAKTSGRGWRHCGTPRTCLFSLSPSPPTLYPATGRDANYMTVSREHGISFGGEPNLPAMGISADLGTGSCLPSLTFGDTSKLASATRFAIACVQLWDLSAEDETGSGEGQGCTDPRAKSQGGQIDSVMQARRADTMMLPFINIERQVAGMRI